MDESGAEQKYKQYFKSHKASQLSDSFYFLVFPCFVFFRQENYRNGTENKTFVLVIQRKTEENNGTYISDGTKNTR